MLIALNFLRRPQRLVLLLAALVPFQGLLLIVPHPSAIAGWKEAVVLLASALALLTPRAERPLPRPGYTPALVALVVVGLLSAAGVVALTGATNQAVLGLKLDFFYVLLVPLLLRCPLSARERDLLVTILMTTAVLTAVIGLAQQVVGADALNRLGYAYNDTIRTASGRLRSFSTFNQPFPFGLFVMLVLLLGLPVALSDPTRLRNRLFLLSTPVLLAGMLSSIVRGAILGAVGGLVYLAVTRYRVLVHLLSPVVVGVLFLPAGFVVALLSSSSLGERATGWSDTASRVLAAPWGNGIGASGSAAEKTALVTGAAAQTYQPDNYFFKTVYELGPVGLWLLVLLLVAALVTARRIADAGRLTARGDAAFADGIAATLVATALAMLVATYLEIFPLDVYFWLLLGVLPSLRPLSRSAPSPSVLAAAASRPTSASC